MFFFSIVDGSWTLWSEWGACSKTCNGGDRIRTRHCNNPVPLCGGKTCPGNNTEVEPCHKDISCKRIHILYIT